MLTAEMTKTPPAFAKNLNLARIRVFKSCTKVSGERDLPASGLCDTLIIEGIYTSNQADAAPILLRIRASLFYKQRAAEAFAMEAGIRHDCAKATCRDEGVWR